MAMGLAERIEGKVLEEAEVLGGKWLKTPPAGINEFKGSLPSRVQRVDVKGKSIQIYLDNGWTIWNTLGMSGGWKDHRTKHSHFRISTQGGREVWFDDVRRFGNLTFIKDQAEVERRLSAVGPDMLGEDVSLELFTSRISHRKTPIAKAIMDQKVISGVGNYIKCEVLYRSRISPHRLCTEITEGEMRSLYEATRWVIR
jgi:formamidopyrimidine-DNA glycosylase